VVIGFCLETLRERIVFVMADVLPVSAPGISSGGAVLLFSVSGQLLASYQLSMVDGASLPVSSLPRGSYFAQVKAGGQSIALSFVKL
jgi:hypothetical protein